MKLTDNAGDFYQGSGYREKYYTRTQTGRAFPEFFGYIVEGIFQTAEEAAAWPKAFGATGTYNKPGHFKYKDVDKETGIYRCRDRTYIGSPHPDFTAGLSLSLGYKGLSLINHPVCISRKRDCKLCQQVYRLYPVRIGKKPQKAL